MQTSIEEMKSDRTPKETHKEKIQIHVKLLCKKKKKYFFNDRIKITCLF